MVNQLVPNFSLTKKIDEMDEDGRDNLMPFCDTKATQKDLFIVMPLGGTSASKMVYNLKGEFFNSERIYSITNGPLYTRLNTEPIFCQDFIRRLVLGLSSLSTRNIVHCDFKLENI
jgi:serine/threonine protein kinase